MNRVSFCEAVGKTLTNIDNEEKDAAKFFVFITIKEERIQWDTEDVIEKCLNWEHVRNQQACPHGCSLGIWNLQCGLPH